MPDRITIKETSKLYNINLNTLYRYIQKGKIKTIQQMKRGKKVQLIERVEIERFLGFTNKYNGVTMTDNISNENSDNTIQLDTIKDNIEAMALYRLGKIESEYKFLQERYETVIQENTILNEKIKELPDKDMYNRVQEENEVKIKELNELHHEEIEQVKKQAEEEQKDLLATIEELKKRLQEEQSKSWFRKLFS